MSKTSFGDRERHEWRCCVPVDLSSLTRFARLDPSAYLSIHPRPDETNFDYPTGGRDPAVCLVVESIENGATSASRNEKPRSTVLYVEKDRFTVCRASRSSDDSVLPTLMPCSSASLACSAAH